MRAAMHRPLAVLALTALLGAAAPHRAPFVPPPPPDAVTQHTIALGGHSLAYTARAGTITLRNAKDEVTAHMFYVAYTRNGADLSRRPVTFFYNGGPGSSTIWLHMGSFSPMRVRVANGKPNPPAPFTFDANPYTLLDKSDLVFVDAPNTGFSRLVGAGDPKDFMGVDQDARAFSQFIQRYVTQFGRWNSPKFLFGESYGTTRDCVLVNMLQDAGVQFNGVVLLSSVLNFGLLDLGGGSPIAEGDWSYVFWLPSEAAAAWYYGKAAHRGRTLDQFLKEVEAFAGSQYLHDLAQGDNLSTSERESDVARLSGYLGLSPQYIRNSDLRIPYPRFESQLLRGSDAAIGRYDARYATYSIDRPEDSPDWDPSDVGISGAFVASLNRYVRETLDFHTNLMYRPTAYGGQLGARWDMHHAGQDPPANVAPDLAAAMSKNPHLHVFSANGYYDFATPFFATVYALQHLNIAPELQKNVAFGFYPSGHMVYLNPSALAAFKRDLDRWYDAALADR